MYVDTHTYTHIINPVFPHTQVNFVFKSAKAVKLFWL